MQSFKSEEQSQLQLVEREELEDEEDLFEAIDKRKYILKQSLLQFYLIPSTLTSISVPSLIRARNPKSRRIMTLSRAYAYPVTSHGINAGDVKKLQDAGIYTCNGLMMHTKKNLTGIKGLSEAKVDKICEAAEKIVNFGYITGSDALLRRKAVVRITTGSQALDELLGGGIETLQITEAFGEFSRPDRIVPIAERFGMDAGAVLDNIVDSVIALFRVDFTGRGELAERQQKLAQMLSRLTKIAEEFNVAVYMTNQVIADPGGGVFISDPKKPAGGHVLAHAATVRLMFRKGKGEQRVCKITAGGIADAKD
ncbi:hypothetical protein L1887_38876 [Cichorium endivia]|nr:hypothetical protein L1887_38876 [Cichorium endivia]